MLNGHKKSPCLSHLNSADSQSPQTRKTTQKQRRKPKEEGPALAVKWLRLCTWIAGVVGSIPGGELRFHMPQGAFQKKKKKGANVTPVPAITLNLPAIPCTVWTSDLDQERTESRMSTTHAHEEASVQTQGSSTPAACSLC